MTSISSTTNTESVQFTTAQQDIYNIYYYSQLHKTGPKSIAPCDSHSTVVYNFFYKKKWKMEHTYIKSIIFTSPCYYALKLQRLQKKLKTLCNSVEIVDNTTQHLRAGLQIGKHFRRRR